ncbi:MAG: hypothetical protein IJL17_07035 [Kiritimatiellae bacterium]|nr:hypothetical protein [Kiritimatiellia bacterium]
MKFVRFGVLKPVKQSGVKDWRSPDYHKPPRRKGFYAMPYGYVDMSYIPTGWTDNDMRIQFLRAEDGRKLTAYDRDHNVSEFKAALRRAGVTKRQIESRLQPSFVAYMEDPANPPSLTGRGSLDQHPHYLLDSSGDKIDADSIFSGGGSGDSSRWTVKGEFLSVRCSFEDINCESLVRRLTEDDIPYDQACSETEWRKRLRRELSRRKLDISQLYAWPVYEHGQSNELYFLKKPHVFEFSGCLWHHFADEAGAGEILQVHEAWVYTTVKALERVLKIRKRARGAPVTWIAPEVFIEEDASAPAQPRRSKRTAGRSNARRP